MSKPKRYFITGVAGTGKTTISKELNKRGIASFDFPSIPDLYYWRNKTTGKKEKWSPEADKEWLNTHETICDIKKLENFLNKKKGIVVVTGVVSGNIEEVTSLFDKVFLLQCSATALLHRLKTRESLWGKTSDQQDLTLEWQNNFDLRMIAAGAIPIDSNGSPEETIKQISDQFD